MSADSLLRPEVLANSLDLWALRREKVLALLDIRAARTARQLARACRLLAKPTYAMSTTSEAWDAEWRKTREEVAALLQRSCPSVRPTSYEADSMKPAMDSPRISNHEVSTRSIDWSEVEQFAEERPTRIAEHGWLQRRKVA